jgi:hypothetical protein
MACLRTRAVAATVTLAISVAASPLHAACPSLVRGSLSEPGSRLSGQWLYEAELRDARRAHTWRYVWSGFNGAVAVGSFAAMPFVSSDRRIELAVGGVYSAVGAVFTWFVPLEIEGTLDRRSSAGTLCQGLHIEEELAARAAADEASRVEWPWHLLNVGAGTLYTAIVGFGTHQWTNGVVDGVGTFVVGEAQLLTQPTRFSRQYEAYGRASGTSRRAWWVLPAREQGALVVALGATF